MRRRSGLTFVLILGVLQLGVLWSTPAVSDTETLDFDLSLDEVIVTARQESPLTGRIHGRTLTRDTSSHLAEAVTSLPGISGVDRGGKGIEPVIRGQGWERVATELGCVQLQGACPARMDPPATYVHPHAVETVEINKGLASVADGPGGIGGTIRVPTDYERSPGMDGFTGYVGAAYDGARSGGRLESVARGGTGDVDLRFSGSWSNLSNYTSASGIEVPASRSEVGFAGTAGWQPREAQRGWASLDVTHGEHVDFPSLPMDSQETNSSVLNAGYRWQPSGESLQRVTLEAGFGDIEHHMNNEDKPNRGMLHAETLSDALSVSSKLRVDLGRAQHTQIAVGGDFQYAARDALRQRRIVASGQVFRDRLWPDATQLQGSVFGEAERELGDRWRLALGGRLGITRSKAAAVYDPSLGGMTIAEQYARFNGSTLSDIDRNETHFDARSTLTWRPAEAVRVYGGLELVTRPAGITERYFAFGPAPGGFLIGNPSLAMEKKGGVEGGVDWHRGWLDLGVSAYYHRVRDYVLSTTLEWRDVNGDDRLDRIRGFRNVSARFQGAELALLLQRGVVQIPILLAFVDGRNLSDQRPLPEIPPFEVSATLRTRWGDARQLQLELGTRFAAAQDEIDPEFGENRTPGWATMHVEGAYVLRPHFRLELGISNLLDLEYNQHLTREALMPVGGLTAGAEIPEPGRAVYAVVSTDF